MTASATGIAGSPIQIGDGVDPTIKAQVYSDNALKTRPGGIDQSGAAVQTGVRTGPDGSTQLSIDIVLTAILIEMRIQTKLLSAISQGLLDKDDPDLDRRDADINHLFDSYNLM